MKKFLKQYKHAFIAIAYTIFYLIWFACIEKAVIRPSRIIHMKADDYIPFCEYFVIPYLLWFAYVTGAVIYFLFKNKQDYYRLCAFLFTGMTIFLIISTLWPNGHHLRPHVFENENIFTALVGMLYRADTPTNLWPSIHVYNSLGVHIAVLQNARLRKNKPVHITSLVLCVSIILSTVFLKQHSVFDVITGFIMAAIIYLIVYAYDIVTVYQMRRYLSKRRRFRQV